MVLPNIKLIALLLISIVLLIAVISIIIPIEKNQCTTTEQNVTIEFVVSSLMYSKKIILYTSNHTLVREFESLDMRMKNKTLVVKKVIKLLPNDPDLRHILDILNKTNPFVWKDKYECKEEYCILDGPTYHLKIKIGNKTKTVVYYAATEIPEDLETLVSAINWLFSRFPIRCIDVCKKAGFTFGACKKNIKNLNGTLITPGGEKCMCYCYSCIPEGYPTHSEKYCCSGKANRTPVSCYFDPETGKSGCTEILICT